MATMSLLLKRIATPLLLTSFLAVAFFGFSFMSMSHAADGRMQGDCPFSAAGTPLCPQDSFAATMHHVSAYQSFFGISLEAAAVTLMSVLLLLAALYIFVCWFKPIELLAITGRSHRYRGPPVSARTKGILRWLSLLEHSPSFA